MAYEEIMESETGKYGELRGELIGVVNHVWSTMLTGEVRIAEPGSEPFVDVSPGKVSSLAGCVHVVGDWHGSVSVQLTESLSFRIADHFFSTEEHLTEANIDDALRELTNMIGGNLKGSLGQRCVLSVPKVKHLLGLDFDVPGARSVLEVTFFSGDEPFVVRVHEDIENINEQIRGVIGG